mgnify:CR=1 FL=1
MDQVILQKIFLYLIIVFSAVFHEFAHAWTAYRLGDTTAKDGGRLTLNPIPHLDPIGTVALPLLLLFTSGMFLGWAKPVPYDPNRLRDQKYGSLKVGVAGPVSNLLIALLLGLLIRFFGATPELLGVSSVFFQFLALIVYINIFLALFNLLPIPPLDGSKLLMDLYPRAFQYLESLGFLGLILALFFAFYLLSPIADFVFMLITGARF